MKLSCAALTALLLILAAGLSAATDFPFNGGFEEVSAGLPIGWEPTGTWLAFTQGPHLGRRCALVPGAGCQPGDRLVSSGYRMVAAGDSLRLRLAYQAGGEGAIMGVLFCDSLGRPLEGKLSFALPPAPAWTLIEQAVEITPEGCPAPLPDAVRVFVGVDRTGVEARFDAVTLTGPAPAEVGKPALPALDVLKRPNLAPNPTLAYQQDGGLLGWSLVKALGFGSNLPPAEGQSVVTSGLVLQAQDARVAWISAPVLVDGSYPYSAGIKVAGAELGPEHLTVLGRALDPADPRLVLLQQSTDLTGDTAAADLSVRLPRLFAKPAPALMQLAAVLPATTPAKALLTEPRLLPEPVTLTVRPVAMAGEFATPAAVTLFVAAVNNTGANLLPTAHLKVFCADGKTAFYEGRKIKISRQSAAYFPFKPKLTAAGDYTMLVRLINNGIDLGSTTFAFKVTGS